MRKFLDRLDRRYVKVATYAVVAALVTVCLGLLVYHSGKFWSQVWDVIMAVMTPLLLGLIFSYLLNPIVKVIEARLPEGKRESTRHNLAVAITMLALAAIVSLLLYLALSTLVQQIDRIRFDDLGAVMEQLSGQYQDFFDLLEGQLDKMGFSLDTISNRIAKVLSGTPEMLTTSLFTIIFTIYFLIDAKNIGAYWSRAFHILLNDKAQATCRMLVDDAQRVFSGYIRGQAVDALVVGVTLSILLTIVGVPYGAIIGVLTGIGNLIPYVTGFVGYGSLIIACFATSDLHSLIVGAICIAIVLLIDSNVINPRLLGSAIKVHPLLVIASLIAGGAVGGILGMLVAVPCGAFIKVQFDRYLDKRAAEADETPDAAAEEPAKTQE
jgi:predicted PurR-regulated permease PerM